MVVFTERMCVIYIFYYISILAQFLNECNSLNTSTLYMERPGKNLCVKGYEDISCSNQVKSLHINSSCLMKYLSPSSIECAESEFKGEMDATDEYGTVNLIPFPWIDYGFVFPALNITFTKIKWKRLKMQFIKVGSPTPQICREFLVSEDIDPLSIISFDCLWGNGTTAEEHYKFQYVLTSLDGHKFVYSYLLQIPKDSDFDKNVTPGNYHMFMLMDQTMLPHISLKLQVPPSRFDIRSTIITLFYKSDLNSNVVKLQNCEINLTNYQEDEFIKVCSFDTDNSPGYYYFNADFQSDFCKRMCLDSFTPQLHITDVIYITPVTVAVFIITISACGLVYFLVLKNKYKKIARVAKKPAQILFVYEAIYPSHIEKIYKFNHFLQEHFYVVTKLDLIDIPKTESMNPWTWYYEAFEEAEYVLVFASPDKTTEEGVHEDNVYNNLHTYALKLLFVHLSNKHKFLVASVKLPGCSWDTFPPKALLIENKFTLPEKLSFLIKFLKLPALNNGSSKLLTILQQPRSVLHFHVTRPEMPLRLPFDAGSFDIDDGIQQQLTVQGISLNLNGQSSGSEEDDDDLNDSSIAVLTNNL